MTGSGPSGHSRAGFALPLVVVVLAVLSAIAGAAVVTAVGDLRLGGLEGAAERAFLAATAGMEHARLVFDRRGADEDAWPVTGRVDEHDYRVTLRRDTFDFGGGAVPVSRDPARPDALNGEDAGEPVWVLGATATRGRYRARQELWIARTAVPRLPAALTIAAAGEVRWRGWNVSGLDDAAAGGGSGGAGPPAVPGACRGDRPAIHFLHSAGGPADVPADSLAGHAPDGDGTSPYVTVGEEAWEGVLAAVRASREALEGRPETGIQHHFSRPDSLSGLTWISNRAGGPLACLSRRGCADLGGRGVLLVHNPRYDPREHDPGHPLYDPSARWDPSRAPARLQDVGGGTFRGLVIVDRWPERPSGSVTIHGALVVLAPPQGSEYRAPPGTSVRYSCRALAEAARAAGLGPRRLGWRPR